MGLVTTRAFVVEEGKHVQEACSEGIRSRSSFMSIPSLKGKKAAICVTVTFGEGGIRNVVECGEIPNQIIVGFGIRNLCLVRSHTAKWMQDTSKKSPMELINEVPPIKVEGRTVACEGDTNPALGHPIQFICLDLHELAICFSVVILFLYPGFTLLKNFKLFDIEVGSNGPRNHSDEDLDVAYVSSLISPMQTLVEEYRHEQGRNTWC